MAKETAIQLSINARDRKNGKNAKTVLPVPSEAQEQTALFQWASLQACKYPELDMLYHIPNGGSRNKIEAARLKGEGVKAGVPDLCLPVPRGGKHGLYIELKRIREGRTSKEQEKWLNALQEQGYEAIVCKGWEAAARKILEYLRG